MSLKTFCEVSITTTPHPRTPQYPICPLHTVRLARPARGPLHQCALGEPVPGESVPLVHHGAGLTSYLHRTTTAHLRLRSARDTLPISSRLEYILNRPFLDVLAMLEVSVGKHFAHYVKEELHMPEEHRCTYFHVLSNGRRVNAWAYAIHYTTTFEKWLWGIYSPQHFPEYERYRARYIRLPAQKTRKRLSGPMNRTQATQQPPFEWE
jgi:hypothetical protein